MSYRNSFLPIWEAPTTSDTADQSPAYVGLANPSTSTAVIVYKSEPGGADITLNLPAGAQWVGQVTRIKTTGTSGTFLAGRQN